MYRPRNQKRAVLSTMHSKGVTTWWCHGLRTPCHQKLDLQTEATKLKQGDYSVSEYFTKPRTIWEELENFLPNIGCTCEVKCSCRASETNVQRKSEDQAMQFLRRLNES